MRVVFLGTSLFAVPVLSSLMDSDHEVACVVTRPPRPAGRGRKLRQPPVYERVLGTGIPVHQPSNLDGDFADMLGATGADILLTASFGAWLPAGVLKAAPLGAVNVHPSLLPMYRGAAPIARTILDGRKKTGVSFMLTDEGWDTGPLIAVYPGEVRPDDTAGTLERRLSELAAEKVADVIEGYAQGVLVPFPQTGDATYAEKLTTEETWLDWNLPAEHLERMVRAFQPSPGARTAHRGKLLKVTEARISTLEAAPGEISAEDGSLTVGCGCGSLEITALRPSGGREMTAAEFLRGCRIVSGERLERP